MGQPMTRARWRYDYLIGMADLPVRRPDHMTRADWALMMAHCRDGRPYRALARALAVAQWDGLRWHHVRARVETTLQQWCEYLEAMKCRRLGPHPDAWRATRMPQIMVDEEVAD